MVDAMMRPRVHLLATLLPVAALAAGETPSPAPKPVAAPSHPWSLGAPLPPFKGQSLRDPKRGEVALSSLRGQPVLVNLWASWCVPCVSELPQLAALHQRLSPRGLKVVGVSIDAIFDEAEMVVGDLDLPFLTLFDPGHHAADAWRAESIPATFLYDRDGALLWRRSGLIRFDDPAFLAALEKALTTR